MIMNRPNMRRPMTAASDMLERSSWGLIRDAAGGVKVVCDMGVARRMARGEAVWAVRSGRRKSGYSSRFGPPYFRQVHGTNPDPRRTYPQSEKRQSRPAAAPAGRDYRPVGIGEIVARVRYLVRGGPAPLCRKSVGLRAPVPPADGKTGRRPDRGPLAGDLDRAEGDFAQSALDGRH